jgi:ABC-type dipeptide/oligopeptide/nickel transport system permease component
MLPIGFEGNQEPFSMVGKNEAMFPIVDFLAHQILGIIGSQIEIEKVFSLVGKFTNLRRCFL